MLSLRDWRRSDWCLWAFFGVFTAGACAGIASVGRLLIRRARSKRISRGVIKGLHRFAVKGLERDVLSSCRLEVGGCFPADRSWALLRSENMEKFDPQFPSWLHKECFYSAYSVGEELARLKTAFDDKTSTLTVRHIQNGALLLRANLEDPGRRREAEAFFTAHLSGASSTRVSNQGVSLRLIRAAPGRAHQFGNTSSGVSASGDTRTVHVINLATVQALCDAAGQTIDPFRFRANILFDGSEPWEEFKWVGHSIAIGPEVRMRVIKRTVRCAGTCVDLSTSSRGADVPSLLARYFPEHGPYLGVYAQVVRAGTIRLQDVIHVLDDF